MGKCSRAAAAAAMHITTQQHNQPSTTHKYQTMSAHGKTLAAACCSAAGATYTPAPTTRRGAHLRAVCRRGHARPHPIPAKRACAHIAHSTKPHTQRSASAAEPPPPPQRIYLNSSTVSTTMHGHHTMSVHVDRRAAACLCMTYTPAPATRRGAHLRAVHRRADARRHPIPAKRACAHIAHSAQPHTQRNRQVQQSRRRRRNAYHNSNTVRSTMHGHHTTSGHSHTRAATCCSDASLHCSVWPLWLTLTIIWEVSHRVFARAHIHSKG
jgi:hypothetical protein